MYKHHEEAAKQGDADAQFQLGLMFANEEGVQRDFKQAVFWFTKAAEQGNAEAQYELGMVCFAGEVVPKDNRQAYSWLNKSAAQGFVSAQFNLGVQVSRFAAVFKQFRVITNLHPHLL